MATRKKTKRNLSVEESYEILNQVGEKYPLMNLKNHRQWFKIKENVFRFTVDLLSLDFLISLMENEKVKDVLFNPSYAPPGGATDSISLRYKVYVEYHQI